MITGYISFGENVPPFIVLRDAPFGYNDLAMTIGQCGLMLGLIIGTNLRINSNSNLGISLRLNFKIDIKLISMKNGEIFFLRYILNIF